VPGTVQATNWSYRLLPTIEDLVANEDLHKAIEKTRIPMVTVEELAKQEKKERVYVSTSSLSFK
jgi:hypothetical protein